MKILAFLIAVPAFLLGGVISETSKCRQVGEGEVCSFQVVFHEKSQETKHYEDSGADWKSLSQNQVMRTADWKLVGEHFSGPTSGFGFSAFEESVLIETEFKSKFGTTDGFTQTHQGSLTEQTFNYWIVWSEWSCGDIYCKMLENRFTTSTTFFSEASEWVSYFLGNVTDHGVNIGRWSIGPLELQESKEFSWKKDPSSVPEPKTNSLFVFGGILMAVGLHMRKK